jgi:hypothetical protein
VILLWIAFAISSRSARNTFAMKAALLGQCPAMTPAGMHGMLLGYRGPEISEADKPIWRSWPTSTRSPIPQKRSGPCGTCAAGPRSQLPARGSPKRRRTQRCMRSRCADEVASLEYGSRRSPGFFSKDARRRRRDPELRPCPGKTPARVRDSGHENSCSRSLRGEPQPMSFPCPGRLPSKNGVLR